MRGTDEYAGTPEVWRIVRPMGGEMREPYTTTLTPCLCMCSSS